MTVDIEVKVEVKGNVKSRVKYTTVNRVEVVVTTTSFSCWVVLRSSLFLCHRSYFK